MRVRLSNKVNVLLFLMAVLTCVNLIVVYHYQSEKQISSSVVNLAGRQRMLSQEITRLVLQEYVHIPAGNGRLLEAISEYEQSLNILSSGDSIEFEQSHFSTVELKRLFEHILSGKNSRV